MQNPMHNLIANDDSQQQQQHTDRIFHATDSLPGHRARLGRRLPSESSFGIHPATSVATSINENDNDNISNKQFGDPPQLNTIHEQREMPTDHDDQNHNHNSNVNMETQSNINIRSNKRATMSNNENTSTHSQPQQFVFGQSSFNSPPNQDQNQDYNIDNNIRQRIQSTGLRENDKDKLNLGLPPPFNRQRISLNASSINNVD